MNRKEAMRPPDSRRLRNAAQSRADVTIHMIRAEVPMSRAADNVSPTAVIFFFALVTDGEGELAHASFFTWAEYDSAAYRQSQLCCDFIVPRVHLSLGEVWRRRLRAHVGSDPQS